MTLLQDIKHIVTMYIVIVIALAIGFAFIGTLNYPWKKR
jgi:hypothetical protein